jgi:carboxyl-terminal processing protease
MNTLARIGRRGAALLLAWGGIAGLRAAEPSSPPASAEAPWPEIRKKTFAEVWQTVNDAYFDPTFGGVDWAAVRETYRPRLEQAADNPALRALLQAMLGELHRTHFAILPRETAVFTPEERQRIGTIGADFVTVENQVVVARVRPDSAAAAAGLAPGDAVRAVNGRPLAEVDAWLETSGMSAARRAFYLVGYVSSWAQAAVGTRVTLRVESGENPPRDVELMCAAHDGAWSEPIGNYPAQPLELDATRSADGIVTLRFNVFAPPLMKGLKARLRALRPGDGLVLDLRSNPGGISVMAPGLSGWLVARELSLGSMTLRQGYMSFAVYPQSGAFAGPVAILIDHGSASTSEILAAGLQEAGRARVFGETSAGAALPSSFRVLPTGDLFQYAVGDMKTPGGKLLEGHGVEPDEVVHNTRADLAAGRDRVQDAARAWIRRERESTGPDGSASPGPADL